MAHNEDGGLVGCGFLKKIRPDAAELKRLYVHPSVRGQGLGRKLVKARIDMARQMGIKHLYADTVIGNDTMLALYKKFGFQHIDRYLENANPEAWSKWLVYLHRPVDVQ